MDNEVTCFIVEQNNDCPSELLERILDSWQHWFDFFNSNFTALVFNLLCLGRVYPVLGLCWVLCF